MLKKKVFQDNDVNNKNIIKDSQISIKKKVEFNLASVNENKINKFPNGDLILNDLKDICEEETNFSFCSIKKEKYFKLEDLSIDRNSNFEILSSYQNLNKISKGRYIKDTNLQKKLKDTLKKYYSNLDKDSNYRDTVSLRTIPFSSIFGDNNSKYEQAKQSCKKPGLIKRNI